MFNEEAYTKLLSSIAPRKIESEEQYDNYLVLVEPLLFADNRTKEDQMIAHILVLLIEEYEEKHYPTPEIQPLDYLLHLMEIRGLVVDDLVPVIKNRNITKLVLNGSCEIDLSMAKALGQFFNVDYKDFL